MTTITKKQKKKKKTIIWIVSGIIGIISLVVIVFLIKNYFSQTSNEDKQNDRTPLIPAPHQEEHDDCPYNESELTKKLDDSNEKRMVMNEEDLQEWRKIPRDYIVKLWKKGYHWTDIMQLREWNLEENDIPNLKSEKRMGVIYKLAVRALFNEPTEEVGIATNLVVIARKTQNNQLKINLDERMVQENMWLPHKPNGASDNLKKVINLVLQQTGINPHYEIFVLSCIGNGNENFEKEWEVGLGKSTGKSSGSTVVLSLLSSLYQKPISWSVAATGAIAGQAKTGKAKTADGKEINISAGDNLPIRGLKAKIEGAIKKEINRFVLSKYQTSPNLLSLKHKESGYAGDEIRTKEKWVLKDDYQKEVSPEIKAKIKEIHWTENIKELRELLLAGKLS